MDARQRKLLVYGYGNPARGDDGLGPALVFALDELGLPDIRVDANYQLVIEDSAELADHDVVIFADAAVSGPAPFWFDRIQPSALAGTDSHKVAPGAVVALADALFGKKVEAYALGIRGYQFDELTETLSSRADANLKEAVVFMRHAVEERKFGEYLQQYGIDRDRTANETESHQGGLGQ